MQMLSILQTLSYNVKSSKYFKETFGCQTKPRVFKENLLLNCSEYLSDKKGWRYIIFIISIHSHTYILHGVVGLPVEEPGDGGPRPGPGHHALHRAAAPRHQRGRGGDAHGARQHCNTRTLVTLGIMAPHKY